MQGYIKQIEEHHYHKHGRLVPELPTDDGVLLRKAQLVRECMEDLVRPLRDAGWRTDVGEPVDRALSMVVNASAAENTLTVALLYSCATANETYKALAEKCDAILYRGAPYNQDQYAYGIDVHVGPVLGWQPPPAARHESGMLNLRRIGRLFTVSKISLPAK